MRRIKILLPLMLLLLQAGPILHGQGLKQFAPDTATYINELRAFTGTYLETAEVPDFERFINMFDSLSYDHQMEIIRISNLMLAKRCRPRPHFITYQRILLEFFDEDKADLGYEAWNQGYSKLLENRETVNRSVVQMLSVSFSVLDESVLYRTASFEWKLQDSVFRIEQEPYPVIYFDKLGLACHSGDDHILIGSTSGRFDPMNLMWEGRGGRVDWTRAGIPEQEMNAVLSSYRINMKTPGYQADSVKLNYPSRVADAIPGRLEDQVSRIKEPSSASYPRFSSYGQDYSVDNIEDDIRFRGGVSMEGATLIGSGTDLRPALLEISDRGQLRVRASSERIILNKRQLRSRHTRVAIYFADGDSIYHPDQQLSLDMDAGQFRLNQSEDFKSMGPYSNSYHGIDMNFDELFWDRRDSVMRFQAVQGSSVSSAIFESNTFFDFDFFMELQGQDYEHPLAQLYMFSNMVQARDFGLLSYADWLGYSTYQVRHLIMGLSRLGFLYYDDETEMVTLRQKLFDYIAASMKQRDYDVIRFVSRTQAESNATLNLYNYDLDITGIPLIRLSTAQDVRLMPEGNRISMKKDKSFEFNGVVDAGLFRFSGSDFHFDYQNFRINLQRIDSMQLSIQTGEYNQYGDPIIEMIDNAFEEMTGVLLIDEPDNKSGLRDYPEYPSFTSFEGAYVYFDKKHIQDGVYHREDFYFHMDPFTIDSLDNFNPRSISPSGTFVSAGILPPMNVQMSLRENNSLGFVARTPEEGYPLYGGLGTFYEEIEMSSDGLMGYGSFDFLSSTTQSDQFVMHPDSMMITSRSFLVREVKEEQDRVSYPFVQAGEADMKLYAEAAQLMATETEEEFVIFHDSASHSGSLRLSSEGLDGEGTLKLPDGSVSSLHLDYHAGSAHADSAGIAIGKFAYAEAPLVASDLEASVNIRHGTAVFESRQDAAVIEMPYNLYETRLDHVVWNMQEDEVILTQETHLEDFRIDTDIDSLKGFAPDFVSLHPGQDSLHFSSYRAVYDYRHRKLKAEEVPFVEVADALIFPDEGKVEVGHEASMSLLENARLVTRGGESQYEIYDATLSVNGAYEYTGGGYYDYTDLTGKELPVFFSRIWVDTTHLTRAMAKVGERDSFELSPRFDFMGDISLNSDSAFLEFDGGVRLLHDCSPGKSWMRFTASIDPEDIRIPVEEQMKNTDLNKIFAGTMITRDSTHIYSAFLSGRKDYFDAPITRAHGVLVYNEEENSYLISSKEKLADRSLAGDLLQLSTTSCLVSAEGGVNLNLDYGQVQLTSAGQAYHDTEADVFSARMLTGLDFFFSPEALQIMGNELDSLPDLEPVDLGDPHYLLGMRDLLGNEMAGMLEREMGLYGAYRAIPEELWHTIFFNDLELEWNQDTRSFRYQGKVGIGNIGDIQVNKKVDAYIELVEKGSGDQFDIYLEAGPNTWYYIAYVPGGLQVLSSNRRFNNIVFDLKANDRRIKGGVGKASYLYSLAAPRRLSLFKERFMEIE